jgi:hypothetical protein
MMAVSRTRYFKGQNGRRMPDRLHGIVNDGAPWFLTMPLSTFDGLEYPECQRVARLVKRTGKPHIAIRGACATVVTP